MTVELNWKIVSVSFCFVLFILFLKPIFSKPDQRYFLVDFLWTTWGLFSPYFIRSLASLPPSWPNWPTSARPAAALVHIDSSLKLSNSRPSVSSFPSRKLLRSFGKASDGENRNGEETFGFRIFISSARLRFFNLPSIFWTSHTDDLRRLGCCRAIVTSKANSKSLNTICRN